MVLPLLLSLGLPALAGTGALGATLATFGVPALAGMGAGLGSFIETGDIGKGIKTGLTSFLGGKVLGGLSGSTSPDAITSGTQGISEAVKPGFIQSAMGPSTPVSEIIAGPSSNLSKSILGAEGAGTKLSFGSTPNATKGGAFTAAQQGFFPGMIGQTLTDAQVAQKEYDNRAAKKKAGDTTIPMPNPMRRTYNPNPYANGGGEGLYFNYQRPARFDGSEVQAPYTYAGGGIMSFQEGGEMEADQMMAENNMNEKDVIVSAVEAIKGMSEQPEIVLALFVQKYGEEALRDLVGRVQSGELDDTVDRFESGDKGMVRGPGDGSGVDDMVPATLEGEQDVLLSDGEFVLREKTTDALEKAYGGGFLDMVNRAEEAAPEKLQQMVG